MSEDTTTPVAHNAQMPRRSPEIGKLTSKMAAVLGAVGGIAHDATSPVQGYSYTSFDAISSRLRGLLAKHGLALFVDEVETFVPRAMNTKSGEWPIVRVVADVTLADAESGQFLTIRWSGEGADPGDKALPKAQTMMLKYFMKAHFLISTGDDDAEADGRVDKVAAEAPAAATAGPRRGRKPAAGSTTQEAALNDPGAAQAQNGHGEPEDVRFARRMHELHNELVDELKAQGKTAEAALEDAQTRTATLLQHQGMVTLKQADTTEKRVKVFTAMKDMVQAVKDQGRRKALEG